MRWDILAAFVVGFVSSLVLGIWVRPMPLLVVYSVGLVVCGIAYVWLCL